MKNKFTFFISLLFLIVSAQVFSQTYKQNDKVEIEYNGSWYPGYIMEVKGDQYKIHYDAYADSWDEWVAVARLKAVAGGAAVTTKTNEAPKAKTTTPIKKETAGTAGTTPAKTKEIIMKEITNDDIGFVIQIPDAAKEETSPMPDVMRNYVLMLGGGLSITIQVAKVLGEMTSIEDAVRDATMIGQKAVKEQRADDRNYLVVKEPQGIMEEFRYYVKTSTENYIFVTCSGPAAKYETCIKIVNSLKATK